MPSFLTDENFDNQILRGLLRRRVTLDIIRVQDIGFAGADDQAVLEQAAHLNRILLTHDVATMPDFAFNRVNAGLSMTGVIVVRRSLPIGQAINEVLMIIDLAQIEDFNGQIFYLPL